jgi:two-component system, NarL family, response regulator NreC
MSFKTTIVLADDHPVVRKGLRALLESQPDLTVVGEASDGLDAVELTERLTPHVLLVDVVMPGITGLEAVRQVKQRVPQVRSIVFSMHATEAYIHEAFKNGACGYILKGADGNEMVDAVHEVAAGRRYLSPAVSERLVEAYLERAHEFAPREPYDELTAREREVLHQVAEGQTNAEIADRLSISPRTVEIHRAHVMRKLNLKTQSDLVRFAIRKGLIPLEPVG